jgi:hypothetical protein
MKHALMLGALVAASLTGCGERSSAAHSSPDIDKPAAMVSTVSAVPDMDGFRAEMGPGAQFYATSSTESLIGDTTDECVHAFGEFPGDSKQLKVPHDYRSDSYITDNGFRIRASVNVRGYSSAQQAQDALTELQSAGRCLNGTQIHTPRQELTIEGVSAGGDIVTSYHDVKEDTACVIRIGVVQKVLISVRACDPNPKSPLADNLYGRTVDNVYALPGA